MAENGTGNPGNGTGAGQEKTFTQDDMNALAGKIRSEEKAKYVDYEELKSKAARLDEIEAANKTELQKATDKVNELQAKINEITKTAEIQAARNKVAEEYKIPSSLLTGDSEEACKDQAVAIIAFTKTAKKVPDGGEVNQHGGTKSTRDLFAEAFDSALGRE